MRHFGVREGVVANGHDFILQHPHTATGFPLERMTALQAVSVSVTDTDLGSEMEKQALKGTGQK